MHRAFLSFIAILQIYTIAAQIPAGYYDAASGLSGKALQQALHDAIDNHRIIPYDSLYICFRKTDVKNDSIVWDMYSDKPGKTPAYLYYYGKGKECGNYDSEADCYNREHSFPKSWFNDMPPMNSDLYHIYPTDGYVNNRRANYPFGETNSPTWTSSNGSKMGACSWPGYTGIIFEPADEYKGDFARTYFYMATRYYGEDTSWPGSDMVTGAQPKPWALAMLLAWHRADSVSVKEINRNNEVYNFQKNRNPFIDNTLFVEKIWGTLNPANILCEKMPGFILYPNPAGRYLFLKSDDSNGEYQEVQIYSIPGMLILQTQITDGMARLDVNDFCPGIYIIRILNAHGNFIGSFVKSGNKL